VEDNEDDTAEESAESWNVAPEKDDERSDELNMELSLCRGCVEWLPGTRMEAVRE
jgi:hypothetical protein